VHVHRLGLVRAGAAAEACRVAAGGGRQQLQRDDGGGGVHCAAPAEHVRQRSGDCDRDIDPGVNPGPFSMRDSQGSVAGNRSRSNNMGVGCTGKSTLAETSTDTVFLTIFQSSFRRFVFARDGIFLPRESFPRVSEQKGAPIALHLTLWIPGIPQEYFSSGGNNPGTEKRMGRIPVSIVGRSFSSPPPCWQ